MNVQFVSENNVMVDPELEQLLPPLVKEDYESLERSLLQYGFSNLFSNRIQVWCPPEEELKECNNYRAKSYIVDGHNRFRICQKHNMMWVSKVVFYRGFNTHTVTFVL